MHILWLDLKIFCINYKNNQYNRRYTFSFEDNRLNLFPSDKALYVHCTYWFWPAQLSSVASVYLRWHLLRNWNGTFQTQKDWPHGNMKVKGQDHWFLPNQSDYSLFAALILLWYWNYNCVLQTNNLSSHWLGQNYTSCPFLVTFLNRRLFGMEKVKVTEVIYSSSIFTLDLDIASDF